LIPILITGEIQVNHKENNYLDGVTIS